MTEANRALIGAHRESSDSWEYVWQRAGGIDALGGAAGDAPRRLEWKEVLASAPEVIVLCCCGKTARIAAQEVARHFLSRPEVCAAGRA